LPRVPIDNPPRLTRRLILTMMASGNRLETSRRMDRAFNPANLTPALQRSRITVPAR
jgi:hypothetical protein